jgi:hypothetical protein
MSLHIPTIISYLQLGGSNDIIYRAILGTKAQKKNSNTRSSEHGNDFQMNTYHWHPRISQIILNAPINIVVMAYLPAGE